jgi:predicted nucleotide-binding protein (sugar kinase/HSP70/actin superfamily)
LSSLKARYRSQEEVIEKLHKHLKDFIASKEEHEAAMLEKFRELLNAKKSKIRDQQRLLSTVKPNSEKGNFSQDKCHICTRD